MKEFVMRTIFARKYRSLQGFQHFPNVNWRSFAACLADSFNGSQSGSGALAG
jgi:hypothetical protein